MRMKKFKWIIPFLLLMLYTAVHNVPLSTAEHSRMIIKPPESDRWFIEAPKEWPAQIMPGVRGGSHKNRSYIDNLIPLAGTQDVMLFFDQKTILTGSGPANEENIGIGARGLLFDEKLILGGNFFYDTRRTESRARFNQLGFGLEGLSKWVDARSNFYFPISDKQQIDTDTSYGFGSRSLIRYDSAVYEEPLTGLDYEVGVLIPYISDYLETRAFIGGYNYFPDKGKGINGIKGRIELRPLQAFTLAIEIKKDNFNPTECFVEGFCSIPLDTMNVFRLKNPFTEGKKYFGYKKGLRPLRERMVDRIIRDIDITSKKVTGAAQASKVHDLTYVDNSYVGASDGTLEHPYTTIANGITNVVGDKWVYVSKGNADYAENLILTDDVTVWGSGYNGGFNGISAPGNPVVDGGGPAADVFTLADGNTVMGFTIQNGLRGIYGQDISGTTVDHNTITDNAQEGILLDLGGATIGTYTISNNTTSANSGWAGIELYAHTNANVNVAVNNNTSIDNINTGAPWFLDPEPTNTDSGRGIRVDSDDNAVVSGSISRNTTSNNDLHGIIVTGSESGVINNFTISNNTANDNASSIGIYVRPYNDCDFTVTLDNNTLSGNHINLTSGASLPNTASLYATVRNNTVSGDASRGIVLGGQGNGSTLTAIISNNIFDNNGTSGIFVGASQLSSISASFSNNTSTNNIYGVYITDNTGSVDADFGGGSMGSAGYNSFYNNTTYDFYNAETTITPFAVNNWWGTTTPVAGQFSGNVTYIPYLNYDPN